MYFTEMDCLISKIGEMCNEVEVLPSLTVFLNLQFPHRFEWIMSDFFLRKSATSGPSPLN